FFQAEDGIRDRNVTGVQTCALPISNLLRFGEVGEFSRPSGECEVWPFFDLSIAVIFSVPSSDLAGRREPDLAVTLSVSDKLAEEMRAERSPADKWVIPPDHELGIRLTLFVATIEAVLPHLQEISRCSPRSLITGVVIEVLKIRQDS